MVVCMFLSPMCNYRFDHWSLVLCHKLSPDLCSDFCLSPFLSILWCLSFNSRIIDHGVLWYRNFLLYSLAQSFRIILVILNKAAWVLTNEEWPICCKSLAISEWEIWDCQQLTIEQWFSTTYAGNHSSSSLKVCQGINTLFYSHTHLLISHLFTKSDTKSLYFEIILCLFFSTLGNKTSFSENP